MAVASLFLVALLLGPVAIPATERKLELRGQVTPPFRWLPVVIRSTNGSYHKQTFTGSDGKFKFKKLEPGHYTIYVFHRRLGETRRSVEVTPSFADEKGRVETVVPVRRSETAMKRQLRQRHMVSFDELAIKDDAREELAKAAKELRKNDVTSAVARLEKAVAISPRFIAAWNQLGVIAYRDGDFARAETCFLKALAVDPQSFPPLVNLGGVLLALRRFNEALGYNRTAVQVHPDDSLANSQLGINYFHTGNHDEAIRYLTTAKRIDPAHFSLPQLTLAEIFARREQWHMAAGELKNLQALHPDSQIAEMAAEYLLKLREAEAAARSGQKQEPDQPLPARFPAEAEPCVEQLPR